MTVHLYADSVDTGLAFSLSAANKTDDDTWTFEATDLNLPATKAGRVISYALTEDAVDGYRSNVTGNIVEKYPAGTGILIHKAPTREGYTFEYWKGSEYQPGDAYTVTEDHTFVAQWKPSGGNTPQPNSEGTPRSSGSTTSLANTGDEPALAGVAIALLGASALALARRRR